MTRWLNRLSAAAAALMLSGWVVTAQAAFTPRVIYTLGELDSATANGDPVFITTDSAVWPEGADEDYSADTFFGFPTWSTDTRGPQSEFSLSVAGNEGVAAPFVAWWGIQPDPGRFNLGVQVWVKPDPVLEGAGIALPVVEDLVGIYIDEEGRWRYARNGDLHEGNRGSTWDFVDSTGDIARVRYGAWQHVAARTDGSSWDIYVDGTKVSTTNSDNWTYGGSGPHRAVGVDRNGEGGFVGLIDDAQFFWYDSAATFATDTQFAQELVEGDTNLDGVIDSVDFDTWRRNIGTETPGLTGGGRIALGDVDLNGVVDLDDFGMMKANRTAGAAGNAVPEPSSFALLGLSAAAWIVLVRRRVA